ncbi:DUF1801 domain-containing protein [Winogradskyella immobilis]|uniref:DUF1801 domain-containing protein n=1 Tax=Winogradskyella immobilis TaxID=2816852 RepID=A0ABS8ENN7_9FLAO|nr:DUF1801 domain-containing protein [Winogradskyella immobilis]MCC1484641.1 DUF1801 domain-containing protein [Winogradskyella immobilis]MCG0016733.1 DUF1801 domain-containing protein [Winogradskyella immobilis]
MSLNKDVHPHFLNVLKYKDQELIDLYIELRTFVLSHYPMSTELLYHTHALTSVYSLSEKLGDSFCMIPIYTSHLNLGFNKGALLSDPKQLLKGTGKLIRHIPITSVEDFKNNSVKALIKEAIELAQSESKSSQNQSFKVVSKIKK